MSNSQDVRMRFLRRRMNRLGVGINDKENGIWLPKDPSSRIPGQWLLPMAGKVFMEMHIKIMYGIP
jgi:hypothetical protein